MVQLLQQPLETELHARQNEHRADSLPTQVIEQNGEPSLEEAGEF